MTLAVWFWLFLVLSVLSSAWLHWPAAAPPHPPYLAWGNSLFLLILLVLLGIAVFGGPIRA